MDDVKEMLSHRSYEPGEFYLLDAGTYLQEPESQEAYPVERPILVLSRLRSEKNVSYERFRPGNPRRADSNFRILIMQDTFQESSPERIGEYNDSTFYNPKDEVGNIRGMLVPYRPDEGMLEHAVEIIEGTHE